MGTLNIRDFREDSGTSVPVVGNSISFSCGLAATVILAQQVIHKFLNEMEIRELLMGLHVVWCICCRFKTTKGKSRRLDRFIATLLFNSKSEKNLERLETVKTVSNRFSMFRGEPATVPSPVGSTASGAKTTAVRLRFTSRKTNRSSSAKKPKKIDQDRARSANSNLDGNRALTVSPAISPMPFEESALNRPNSSKRDEQSHSRTECKTSNYESNDQNADESNECNEQGAHSTTWWFTPP